MSTEETEKKATNGESKEELPPLTTGIPPWHSIAFLALMLPASLPFLPSLEEIDALSEPHVWTTRKFPEWLSLWQLAMLRLGIAATCLSLTLWLATLEPGWDVWPNYKPHSKLRRVAIRIQGIGTMCPFTSWSWFLLGVGFLCRGIIALAASEIEQAVFGGQDGTPPPAWATRVLTDKTLLRTTLLLWELSGPFAILVSCVVKFVIWPEVAKGGKPHKLASFRNQLQHNCNSIFALAEVTLLGGLSVEFSHLSISVLFGIVYILFQWTMARIYFGNSQVGPQYIYWFFDTTLGKTTTIALVGLFFVLTLFFVVFSVVVSTVLGGTAGEDESPSPNMMLNVAFLVTGTLIVCKFKD